jgi:hypothetical protein
MNIYSLYVTTTRSERKYFKMLLTIIKNFNNFVNIVHLDFKYNETVKNLKINKKVINYTNYVFENGNVIIKTGTIVSLDSLIEVYKLYNIKEGKNIFMYSGHSNGLYLKRHKINILEVQDFCDITFQVLKKKVDLIVFDCCLCGNINCLSVCRNYTDYIIASSGYWSELSLLQTKSIYLTEDYKKMIDEMITIENKGKNFITNYVLYNLNEYLNVLIKLVNIHFFQFKSSKSYVIDKVYYKDLECCFKDIGINIKPILQKVVIFQRFKTKNCYNIKKSVKANKSYPSSMFIILRDYTR